MGHPELDAAFAEDRVAIRNRYGLHGRPTTMFVKLASQFASEIRVCRDGDPENVDGKSAIAILSLGLEHDGILHIQARGPDATKAIAALSALVRNKFSEE